MLISPCAPALRDARILHDRQHEAGVADHGRPHLPLRTRDDVGRGHGARGPELRRIELLHRRADGILLHGRGRRIKTPVAPAGGSLDVRCQLPHLIRVAIQRRGELGGGRRRIAVRAREHLGHHARRLQPHGEAPCLAGMVRARKERCPGRQHGDRGKRKRPLAVLAARRHLRHVVRGRAHRVPVDPVVAGDDHARVERPAARVHFLQQRERVRVGFVIEDGRANVDDELLLGGELVEPLEQRQPGSRAQAPGILHERLRGDAQCLHREARALEARLRLPQPRGGRGDLLRVLIRIQVDEGGDRPHRRIAGGRQGTPEQERAGEHAAPQP